MSKITVFSNPLGIVLASSSSYRKALLDRLGLQYSVFAAAIDETPHPREEPSATAQRLAQQKARAVAQRFSKHLVIGSDQVATCDGYTPLGKPLNHTNAVAQLEQLSGKRVFFYTAVCLLNSATNTESTVVVPTEVEFRRLARATIEEYLRRERPYDCTGSAKIESLGIALVKKVLSDDPTALIGLPLIALTELLQAQGTAVISPE